MALDSDRWRRVEELCERALALDHGQRPAFLASACAGDEALRREVESLLAQETKADGFLGSSTLQAIAHDAMGAQSPSLIGRRIGAYEVRAWLGAGGMGEVYRARDTKLGRDVAIKMLPLHLTADRERLARFEREARLLASLNHPHIGAIYGLEESDASPASGQGPTRALVLELIEGETLADRLARGALKPGQALALAIQIADALDHAHRRGVTHRDLKPSNVMLTTSGAKLLDFGLANWSRPTGAAARSGPTLPAEVERVTIEGAILGTLHYMSPEQLEGREADVRSDLFAFGAVLYEMLTGRQAFEGTSQASIIAAILSSDPPPPSAVAPQVPARLDRVIGKCLAKDPDTRWQSARDLADELQWILEDVSRPSSTSAVIGKNMPRRIGGGQLALLALLASLVVAAVVWTISSLGNEKVTRAVTRFVVQPSLSMDTYRGFDISPDGSQLAYIAREGPGGPFRLFLRRLDEFDAVRLPATDDARFPVFSEDGQSISFTRQNRKIEKSNVRTLGVPVQLSTNSGEECVCRDFSWAGSDTMYYMRMQHGIHRMSAEGGQPVEVTKLGNNPPEVDHHSPELLPGGRAMLFAIHQGVGRFAIAVQILATGDRKTLVDSGFDPHYLPSGHLVYASGHAILAAPFDVNRLELTGPAVPLVDGVGTFPEDGVGSYRLARNGTLIFLANRSQSGRRLTWVDRSGRETPISIGVRSIADPRLSPDGKLLAFAAGTDDRRDIWLYEFASDKLTRITSEGDSRSPVWSPDGRRLTYASIRDGMQYVFWQPIDGNGPAEPLVTSRNRLWPSSWTGDGRTLLYWDQPPTDLYRSYFVNVDDDRQPHPLFAERGSPRHPSVSPNGRWVAYTSHETGRTEVYVAPFPASNTRHQITVDGGHQPRWSRDGRQLFYRWRGNVFAVPVNTGETFTAGKALRLFTIERYVLEDVSYDADASGSRFVMLRLGDEELDPPRLNFVLNWTEELMRRVPTR